VRCRSRCEVDPAGSDDDWMPLVVSDIKSGRALGVEEKPLCEDTGIADGARLVGMEKPETDKVGKDGSWLP
jgi:hypothetical protein